MSAVHLHLLLNHFPVIGVVLGVVLLAVALAKKSVELTQAGLCIFVVVALAAVPTFLTGEPAEEAVAPLPDVSEVLIERHEAAAKWALAAAVILGVVALAGLGLSRRSPRTGKGIATMCLILSLVVCGLMMRTANLGGQIRHSEIRGEAVYPPTTREGRAHEDDEH